MTPCPHCGAPNLILMPINDKVIPGAVVGHPEYEWVRAQLSETQCCQRWVGRWFGCDEHGRPVPRVVLTMVARNPAMIVPAELKE